LGAFPGPQSGAFRHSNILVAIQDEEAVPKVIDFGVARAISQPLTERTL
jgi:hypothetical protein